MEKKHHVLKNKGRQRPACLEHWIDGMKCNVRLDTKTEKITKTS